MIIDKFSVNVADVKLVFFWRPVSTGDFVALVRKKHFSIIDHLLEVPLKTKFIFIPQMKIFITVGEKKFKSVVNVQIYCFRLKEFKQDLHLL